jgi:erythromycin esterase-like protein
MKREPSHSAFNINDLISKVSTPLNDSSDLDPLMKHIGDAKYVLLGEASHGTHEYYNWRAKISKRLIAEKGFSFIAVEGDWPDCYRINRYVKNYMGSGEKAIDVLHEFNRWPTWMWANWEVLAFTEWLKKNNENLPLNKRIGFYGLDVYSLHESMDQIVAYLKKNDPKTLQTAMKAMHCFEPFHSDEGQSYARASKIATELCESDVHNLLKEIRGRIAHYNSDYENVFSTEQNAIIAVHAEKYYRALIRGGAEPWNIRDRHMVSTLNRLMDFHGSNAKVIVWAHNTHVGDARATDMAKDGLVNVGQLLKQQYESDGVVSVGFGSYQGTVIAGREWSGVMRKIMVPPAQDGSWEHILHNSDLLKNKLVMLNELKAEGRMAIQIGHRAIGVVYNPEYEKYGNYVPSVMPNRYDAFIFIDESTAINPLHIKPDGQQIPETFPFGV